MQSESPSGVGFKIPRNMLAGADSHLQVIVPLKMIVSVQKRVADERSPNDRGNAFGR